MKKVIVLFVIILSKFLYSQQVYLTEAVSYHENSDKYIYALEKIDTVNSKYLGTIEMFQALKNEVEAFNLFYKKAKSLGANSFSTHAKEDIDGSKFQNTQIKIFKLYYTKTIDVKSNIYYLIGDSQKNLKVVINNKKLSIQPKSYIKRELFPGEIQEVSTGGVFGSKIKLSYKENQNIQYFKILGNKISSSDNSTGGINFKSGDIISLERSFAEFLIALYE